VRLLTLEEALQSARDHAPQLRQARAATRGAEARADQVHAPAKPQVRGSADYLLQNGYTSRTAPSAAAASSGATISNGLSARADASLLLWDSGRTEKQWQAARATALSQSYDENVTLADALYSVESSFFGARAQRALSTVARDALANQERHLRQVQGFVDAGTRPEIDLAAARTAVANARVQFVTAENAYESAKAALNRAMGVEASTDYDVADTGLAPVAGEDAPTDALLAEALRARPEFAAFSEQERAQELQLEAVRRAVLPTVSATAGVAASETNTQAFVQSAAALDGNSNSAGTNWSAGLSLTWPLFQGGLYEAQADEAAANLDSLRALADALRLQVRLDVEQARLAVRGAAAAREAAGEASRSAAEQLRLAEGRYEAGVGNIIELGDSQLGLVQAQAQVVQADFNLASARAQLLRALGRRP